MKKNAFTLIELLVVIVIIGILSVLSIATFNGSIEKARVTKSLAFATQVEKKFLASFAALAGQEQTMLFYHLDEGSGNTMNDSSGSGNNMTFTESATQGWSTETPDQSKSSRFFTAQAQNITWWTNNPPSTEITFSFFLKLDSNENTYMSPLNIYNNTGITVYDDGKVRFFVNENRFHPENYVETSPGVFELGKWHHILATYTNTGRAKIYIDGKLEADKAQTLNILFDEGTESIRLGNPYGTGFDGKIDRISIYPIGYDE